MDIPLIMRPNVIAALAQIREDWEIAVEGESLLKVQGNIGMMFSDIVVAVGLTAEEKQIVLGKKLLTDLNMSMI